MSPLLVSADTFGNPSSVSGILAPYKLMERAKGEVTLLLEQISAGDRTAEQRLLPLVYSELHRLATVHLSSERTGHTLQPTALVHEAYLRLCSPRSAPWEGRSHFLRFAAKLMRQILVDYARQRNAAKRGNGKSAPFDEALSVAGAKESDLLMVMEVDDALRELAELNPRQAQVVEMRFFGGLEIDEIAASLGVTSRTVKRDWFTARAWLHQKLRRD